MKTRLVILVSQHLLHFETAKLFNYSSNLLYLKHLLFLVDIVRKSGKHSRQGRRATAHTPIIDNNRAGLLSFDHLERPPSSSPLGKSWNQFGIVQDQTILESK